MPSDVIDSAGDRGELHVGVCLSGGGHRATAWGAGILAAIIGAGLHRRTVSIGSVSGGSILNAAVATSGDFRQVDDAGELARRIAPTLRVVATDGLFLPGRPTTAYVRTTLAALVACACSLVAFLTAAAAVERGHPWWPYGAAGAVLGALGGWITSQTVTHRLAKSIAVGIALGGATATVTALIVRDLHGVAALAAVAVTVVLTATTAVASSHWLGRRGDAVTRALSRQFATPTDPAPLLRDITSEVNHVFCTTDLESGEALYFAPRFAYGYRRGLADMAASSLSVGRIAQASAAVPPGFAPAPLDVPEFVHVDDGGERTTTPPGTIFVSDGGVYDNLGEQWEWGLRSRLPHYPALGEIQQPANLLIVGDASPRFGYRRFEVDGPLHLELAGVARNVDVMWAATTSRRRHDLYEQFVSRDIDREGGALVMIDRSPIDLCRAAALSTDPGTADRARATERFLLDRRSAEEWASLTDRCAKVPTTLGPLSVPTTLDLLEHGYVSTMVLLHVFLGRGDLRDFPADAFVPHLR